MQPVKKKPNNMAEAMVMGGTAEKCYAGSWDVGCDVKIDDNDE